MMNNLEITKEHLNLFLSQKERIENKIEELAKGKYLILQERSGSKYDYPDSIFFKRIEYYDKKVSISWEERTSHDCPERGYIEIPLKWIYGKEAVISDNANYGENIKLKEVLGVTRKNKIEKINA